MSSTAELGPKLRIAHVVLQLDVGGMEKLLVEFARHADRRRIDLHFISLGTRGVLANDIEALGWPVTALQEPPGLRPGLVLRLARLFRRLGADIVHTHNSKPLLYASPAACLAGVPRVIHTRHGQRNQMGRQALGALRLAARLADRVVCVSHDSAQLSAAEGIARNRLCTIWNGIDVRRFRAAGPCPDGPVVAVGRLSPEKDYPALIHAAAALARVVPSFRLEIAGNGPCAPQLHQLIDGLGLAGRVQLLGEVRDVAALLARASLFVLPSLTEGISLALLEAMSVGLPVVATRVGGNPEVVEDGVTGFLVPPADPTSLAGAMQRLLRDPSQARLLGLAGRQRAEKHFDSRETVAAYEDLYRNVQRP